MSAYEKAQEKMLNKYIPISNLEWRILNYLCKMRNKYASFPETELLVKTGATDTDINRKPF
jgi:hypothetical protein